ncbi:MAG: ribonuclease HI family protein [Candidatus Omnitrophota bacterium]
MRKARQLDEVQIFSDGGSRGNPGPAAVGAVLINAEGVRIREVSKCIGTATNNVAEYLAVIHALQEAILCNAKKVVLNLDSQLVARQLKGEYKVKNQNIKKFFDITLKLLQNFDKVEIKEIPRSLNKEADRLVNKALNLR